MLQAIEEIFLQSWESTQQMAEDPSSRDMHFESWSVHLKFSGNLVSVSLQFLSSRRKSLLADSDLRKGMEDDKTWERKPVRAKKVKILWEFVDSRIADDLNWYSEQKEIGK